MSIPQSIKHHLIKGFTVALPVLAVVFFFKFCLEVLAWSITLLPTWMRTSSWLGASISTMDVLLLVVCIWGLGVCVSSRIGKMILQKTEYLLDYLPIFRTLYRSVKEGAQLFFRSRRSFSKVVLLEYPRKGVWSLGFLTHKPTKPKIDKHVNLVSVFVPTTPNPTSGYVLMLPESEVSYLDISVEDALRFVISVGASGQDVLGKFSSLHEMKIKSMDKGV